MTRNRYRRSRPCPGTSWRTSYRARTGPANAAADSSTGRRTFTGSGVFKGYNNVSSLLEIFAHHDHLDAALDDWGATQVRMADRLLALGEQMEQAYIWDTPDLATADAETTEAWWRGAVEFPDDFTYEAEP